MGRGTRTATPAAAADESLRRALRAPAAAGTPEWVRTHEPRETPDPAAAAQRVDDLDPRRFGPGTRVELVHLAVSDGGFDDTALLPPGTRGTVSEDFDPESFSRLGRFRQIPINWDNGSTLQACGDDQLVPLIMLPGAPEPVQAPEIAGPDSYQRARELRARLQSAGATSLAHAASDLGVTDTDLRLAELADLDEQAFIVEQVLAHDGPMDLTFGRERLMTVRTSRVQRSGDGTLGVLLDNGAVKTTIVVRPGEVVAARHIPL